MMTFAAPGFLLAGALLTLAPLALHMLARTPPERRPLPTARFLDADRRTRLRLRRPTDVGLLALRVSFLLLLGAAFAGPSWLPDRRGGTVVVLLDAGQEMAPVWDAALAAAREGLGGGGTLVVFDTVARVADDPGATLDSLRAAGPAAGRSDYLVALRGLKTAAVGLPAESASAVLVTRPRWGAWSPGVTTAREAAWRARIAVVALEPPGPAADGGLSGADDGAGPPRGAAGARAVVVGPAGHPLRPYVTAALQALGYERGSGSAVDLVLVLPGGDTGQVAVPEVARMVVLGGPPPGPSPGPGGSGVAGVAGVAGKVGASRESARSRGRLVLPGGWSLDGWLAREGRASPDGVVLAVWEDGRPAASARRGAGACVAYLAAEPADPGVAADPAFPRLIRTLADGCGPARSVGEDGGPGADPAVERAGTALDHAALDAGALALLRGDGLPAAADLPSLEGRRGRPLARVLLALALVVALAEAGLAYGRRVTR